MHAIWFKLKRHIKRISPIKRSYGPLNDCKDRFFGIRHLQAILMFFGLLIAYAVRTATSVGIVAMTDPTASTANVPTFPEWSKQIQDTILSSFFWGYIVLQVPAGMISERYGGKLLLTIALLSNGLISLIIPISASWGGWQAVCACRVLQGLGQSAIFPCMHGLQAKWVVISERSRFTSFIYAGSIVGTVFELILAGFIGGSSVGWPTIFYSLGVAALLWTVAWVFMAADSPRQHKWMPEDERKYIEASYVEGKKQSTPPWKSIFTSAAFWSLLLAHCGQNWGFWTLLTELPSYMKSVLNVDIKANGLMTALPYIAMYLLSFVFSFLSDYGINKKIVSIGVARKIANSFAHMGPAIFLIGLSYTPAGNILVAEALLTFTVGLNGAHYVGFCANHLDLSPNFAATLMGITNMVSNVMSIIAPLSVGFIIKDESKASEWRKVFFLSSAIYFIGNLAFVIFGSGEVQSWNYSNAIENDTDTEKAKQTKEDTFEGEADTRK